MSSTVRRNALSVMCAAGLVLVMCERVLAQSYIESPRSAFDGLTPKGLEPGAPAGSYALSGLDSVNLYNGSLSLTIPLLRIGGRGDAGYTIQVPVGVKWNVTSELVADPPPGCGTPCFAWYFDTEWWANLDYAYRGAAIAARYTGGSPYQACPSTNLNDYRYAVTLTRITARMPDGTEVELRDALTGGEFKSTDGLINCTPGPEYSRGYNRGRVWVAADGSATTFMADTDIKDCTAAPPGVDKVSGVLFFRDGTQYRFVDGNLEWIRDRNGNKTTFQQIPGPDPTVYSFAVTDPLGRTTEVTKGHRWIVNPDDESVNGYYDQIKFKGAEGQDRFIRVYRRNYWPDTMCGGAPCTPKATDQLFPPIGSVASGIADVVSKIELPDGKTYKFTYNEYAEVIRVELPTGGAYEYTWDNGDPVGGPIIQLAPNTNRAAVYRRVIERREYPSTGSLARRSTYAATYYNQNGSLGDPLASSPHRCAVSWCTEVVETDTGVGPSSNAETLAVVRHRFYGSPRESLLPETFEYPAWSEGKEFFTSWETAQGAIVRQEKQLWQQRATPSWWTGSTAPPGQGPEPALDTRVLRSDRTIEDGRMARTEFSYAPDNTNNRTDTWEYDYGNTSGSQGPVVRYTHTDYVTSAAYVSAEGGPHLRSLPLRKVVCGPWASCTDNESAAKTEYGYDEADLAALTPRSDATGHDSTYDTSLTSRGNVTSVRVWRNEPTAGWLITRAAYDILGNVTAIQDPNGAADGSRTTIGYQDCFSAGAPASGHTYAFRTSVQNPLQWSNSSCYDYYLGRPTSLTDPNNVSAIISYGRLADGSGTWDSLDRVREIVRASGLGSTFEHRTTFTYSDTPGALSLTTTSDQLATSDQRLKTVTEFDGFGRKVRSTLYEADASGIQTETQYDGLGRALRVSNPYRSGTPLWTTTTYDPIGRVKRVLSPDSSEVTTTYSGATATIDDEADNRREATSDALGRLVQLKEDPTGLAYLTSYQYDQQDNLKQVNQGAQPSRTFTYDTAGRLRTATNPESGTTEYIYDDNSNLKTKTDARGYVTVLDYDRLDRLTRRQQPDGLGGQSVAVLCYDGQTAQSAGCTGSQTAKGALTGSRSAASSTTYTRDALLRATASAQSTQGYAPAGFTYQYNVDGTVASMTYPSTRTVTYAYDRAGRVNALAQGTESIASSIAYAAHGAVESLSLGNGLYEGISYNSRLQPYEMRLGASSGGSDLWKLVNTYPAPGANNGNVLEQQITAAGVALGKQVYKYDRVNRLKLFAEGAANESAETCAAASAPLCQQFDNDQWGNRLITARSGLGTGLSEPGAFSTATNRISTSGFAYDHGAAGPGNLTATPGGTFEYDAENLMISATTSLGTTSYVYDGEGRRVKKIEGTQETMYVYDAMGQLAAEYGGAPPAVTGRVYLTQDHLGSTRIATNAAGHTVERRDYLPFGETLPVLAGSLRQSVQEQPGDPRNGYTAADATALRFTGKERDAETGLDYFGARYFSGAQGRFTSPDPIGGHLGDPQTLNKYAYVRNNPLRYVDPNGLDFYLKGGDACNTDDGPKCDKQGFIVDDKWKRVLVGDKQLRDSNSGITGTFDKSGIHITTAQGTFSGVFATGTPATTLLGSGLFEGFVGVFNARGLNTNVAQGTLFGSQEAFQKLIGSGALVGPNVALDVLNRFHPGLDNYRGGNDAGADPHVMIDPAIMDPTTSIRGPIGQGFHFDTSYPFGDVVGFVEHAKALVDFTFQTKILRRKDTPAPSSIPPFVTIPR